LEKNFERAKRYVMWLLSKKDYTHYEILNKLKQKNYTENIINKVFKFINEYKFINENKIIEKTIENGIKKFKSPIYIKNKLLLKGIKYNNFKENLGKIDEFAIAYNLAFKKIKKVKNNYANELKYKIFKYLSTKGFNYDIIESVINKIFKNKGMTDE